MASIYDNQIKNRNFLSPTGFKFILNRAPKVSFFGNEANIPITVIGTVEKGLGVSVLNESGGIFNQYRSQGFDHFNSRA